MKITKNIALVILLAVIAVACSRPASPDQTAAQVQAQPTLTNSPTPSPAPPTSTPNPPTDTPQAAVEEKTTTPTATAPALESTPTLEPTPELTASPTPQPAAPTATPEAAFIIPNKSDLPWQVLDNLGHDFMYLAAAATGEVWAVSTQSLFQFKDDAGQTVAFPTELAEKIKPTTSRFSHPIRNLSVGPRGTAWLGTSEDGLYRLENGNWTHFTTADGLAENDARRVAINDQNNAWVLGQNTVSRFDGQAWQPIPLGDIDNLTDMTVTPTGQVWLAAGSGGIYQYDGSGWISAMEGWNAGSVDMLFAVGREGQVWLGSDKGWMYWAGQQWQGINASIPAPFSFPVAVDATGGAWGIVSSGCYFCKLPNLNENGAVYVTPNRSCRFTAVDGLGGPPLEPTPDPFDTSIPRPDQVWDIAVATDGSVWFITQGRLTIFRPQQPVCDYARPEQVRTPKPSECSRQPEYFAEVWQERQAQLGCPVENPPHPVLMAWQPFEGGQMFWWGDTGTIMALSTDGNYWEFEDTWDESQPAYSCPALGPAQTPPTPQRGFGKVWCQQPEVRARLGPATGLEQSFEATLQRFERGAIFKPEEDVTYILDGQGNWEQIAPQN